MADPTTAASIRAAMKVHGLTQKQVGTFLGVSDRMVRQVLSGAKPGANLAGGAAQLAKSGVVSTPPVRREQRVRTGPKGAPTAKVVPVKTRHSVGAAGRSQSAVDVPARGLGREASRQAITQALGARRGGATGRGGKRVVFQVTTRDGRQMTIGKRGGYDPARVLQQIDDDGGDPYEWLVDQFDAADIDGYDLGGVGAIASVSMTFL